jgi:small subunit ribosomal protein S6
MNKRNYKATFILDNRGKEDSVDQLIEGVKKEIAAVQGEVTAVEQLGRRDFVRVTDPKMPAGVYVQVAFTAPADATKHLHERLRLNDSVHRALVEKA